MGKTFYLMIAVIAVDASAESVQRQKVHDLRKYQFARVHCKELVYFCEDDYLHSPNALKEMLATYQIGKSNVKEGKMVETALMQRKPLEAIAGKSIDDLLEVYRISTGEAHFWTTMDVLKEQELERVKF